MEANSSSWTSCGEAAQHHYNQGLSVLPLDPNTLRPAVDTAIWLSQLTPSTIARHWQNSPDDAVGYVLQPSHLVISASTTRGSDALHALGDVHRIVPKLIHFGRGGETWHLTLDTSKTGSHPFASSDHLLVRLPGDVALLHPAGRIETNVGDDHLATDAFLGGLAEITQKLSAAGASDDPAKDPPVLSQTAQQPPAPAKTGNPIERFSITGKSAALSQLAQAQVLALGQYAVLGQATALYAAPNTGKTLIVLHDLGRSIKAGALEATKVFYFNLDDNSAGLLSKLHFAEAHGFHMVADGHEGFSSRKFLQEVQGLIGTDHPKGMVLVLDTVKKVADLMDKRAMADFTAAMRRFVMKGGTVIALAHTNKHASPNGRPVYAGTSDMVDDFDCAYTLQALPRDPGGTENFVELKNFKRRGGVADQAIYSYSLHDDYAQLLRSVREVSAEEQAQVQQQAQLARDADVIAAIKVAIQGGDVKRMTLLKAARIDAQVSRNEAEQVLDRYAGDDPKQHLWQFSVVAHGAKVYRLHDSAIY